MVFKPVPCKSRWEGLAVCTWILLIDLLLVTWIWRRPVDLGGFGMGLLVLASLPFLTHVGQRTAGAFKLEYWVDRDAVSLRWIRTCQVIPLSAIRQVIDRDLQEVGGRNWSAWPVPFVRPARARGLVGLRLFATQPLSECLVLDTGDSGLFAISPADRDGFLRAMQECRLLGPARVLRVEQKQFLLCGQPVARDPVARILLGAGFIAALVIFGVLMREYPSLRDVLPLHYNRSGVPDVLRPKSALFLLPVVALSTWSINGLWGALLACRGERIGAYLLWGGTIIVQLLSLLALLSLMT